LLDPAGASKFPTSESLVCDGQGRAVQQLSEQVMENLKNRRALGSGTAVKTLRTFAEILAAISQRKNLFDDRIGLQQDAERKVAGSLWRDHADSAGVADGIAGQLKFEEVR